MATTVMSVGSIRSPTFLTRSWVLTPSHLNYQIPHQNIPRNPNPFRVRAGRHDGKPFTNQSTRTTVRKFHSSQRRSSKPSAIPHISMHIAASSSGKGSKFQAERSTYDYVQDGRSVLGLQKDEHTIFQKRRARPDSGQDAYFVAPVGEDTDELAFAVCDGVGGWSDHGVDPADFSHGLCHYMAKTAMTWSTTSKEQERLKPQQLLELGYDSTVKDAQIKAGGTTACVAITDGKGRIRIANLGDSGYIQLRLGTVQNYSSPQTHAFNTPYQLSLTPPEMVAQAMIFGGLPLNDHPERADIADHTLQHGDVLVLATDGLWDNLSSQDILTIVSNQMRQCDAWHRTSEKGFIVTDKLTSLVDNGSRSSQPKAPVTLQAKIAAAIVGEAKAASQNRKRDGPFAKAWQKQMPYDPFHGGKVDDITVMVVIASEDGKNSNNESEQQLKAKL